MNKLTKRERWEALNNRQHKARENTTLKFNFNDDVIVKKNIYVEKDTEIF